ILPQEPYDFGAGWLGKQSRTQICRADVIRFVDFQLAPQVKSRQSHGKGKSQQQAQEHAESVASRNDLFVIRFECFVGKAPASPVANLECHDKNHHQRNRKEARVIEYEHGLATEILTSTDPRS